RPRRVAGVQGWPGADRDPGCRRQRLAGDGRKPQRHRAFASAAADSPSRSAVGGQPRWRSAMTADGQRIASLERQVAGLSARVEQLARQAFVIKTLEEITLERAGYGSTGATSSALQAAFDAGRASVGQD